MPDNRHFFEITVRVEVDLDAWALSYGTGDREATVDDARGHITSVVQDSAEASFKRMGSGAEVDHVRVARDWNPEA